MMSMCPFLAARWRGDVPLGSVVSPFLGSSRAAHMLLDSNNWTTYTHTHTHTHTESEHKQHISSFLWIVVSRCCFHIMAEKKKGSYPDSAKLTGQVQRGFPCVIHNTRVGLVLQQHLWLETGNIHTSRHTPTHEEKKQILKNQEYFLWGRAHPAKVAGSSITRLAHNNHAKGTPTQCRLFSHQLTFNPNPSSITRCPIMA